jgi:hypothetical protein
MGGAFGFIYDATTQAADAFLYLPAPGRSLRLADDRALLLLPPEPDKEPGEPDFFILLDDAFSTVSSDFFAKAVQKGKAKRIP